MTNRHENRPAMLQDRRDFLKRAAAAPFAATAAAAGAPAATAPAEDAMPTVPLGSARISRLVLGSNTINGGSHLSRFVDFQMREYFTDDRILETLQRASARGITAWQASGDNHEHWQRFKRAGGAMHFLSLASAAPSCPFTPEEAARMGFLGLAHHGEVTDQLFKAGRLDEAREYLKRVRDAGLCTGLSTHMPAVVERVEEQGWDIDFYMTCIYERHRSREELARLLGRVPIPVGEVYLEEDPPRMFEAIRATRKTCLAFKILAAGRLCQSAAQVAQAFERAFRGIKPSDAVIVGIFPRWSDQIAEDADLVKKHGRAEAR
ncbi:MAG TPA: hypothetical protein DCM87_21425 [Planctomycetes bacterium]|nr:hypothetical protein [Planctomycetota bacterium]